MSSSRPTPIPATGPRGEAGVVHQHVDLDLPLRQRLHDLVSTAGQGKVRRHDLNRDPGLRRELAGQLPQPVLAAGDERQVRAIVGELPGQFPPDPRRGTGNQHRLTPVLPRRIPLPLPPEPCSRYRSSRTSRCPSPDHATHRCRQRSTDEIPTRGSPVTRPQGSQAAGHKRRMSLALTIGPITPRREDAPSPRYRWPSARAVCRGRADAFSCAQNDRLSARRSADHCR